VSCPASLPLGSCGGVECQARTQPRHSRLRRGSLHAPVPAHQDCRRSLFGNVAHDSPRQRAGGLSGRAQLRRGQLRHGSVRSMASCARVPRPDAPVASCPRWAAMQDATPTPRIGGALTPGGTFSGASPRSPARPCGELAPRASVVRWQRGSACQDKAAAAATSAAKGQPSNFRHPAPPEP